MLYDNTQNCPVCGSEMKRIEYYSARVIRKDGESKETIDESTEYYDVCPCFAGYCCVCARETKDRANYAAAERARKKMGLYLILGCASALLAAVGLGFAIWCRRNFREIGSERWILGGTGIFAALAFTVIAGIFFFLRPVERLKLSGQPYKEPAYAVLSEGAAVQATTANMENEPERVYFSVTEYERRFGKQNQV